MMNGMEYITAHQQHRERLLRSEKTFPDDVTTRTGIGVRISLVSRQRVSCLLVSHLSYQLLEREKRLEAFCGSHETQDDDKNR